MTVAIAGVGRQGRLDIAFALRNDRTVIRHSYCEVPYKITRLLDSEVPGFAHLILMHTTAGLFGGDEIECAIHVEAGARVVLTQQSATKVHPSGALPATQRTRIVVESEAELIVDFEPAIPFAESRLHQSIHIEVKPGASLVFWEGMMAGRIGKNERWRFAELMTETRLAELGRLLYLDRVLLNPSREHPESHWVARDCGYVGTGLCFRKGAAELAGALHDAMPDAGVDNLGANLVAVRVATPSGPNFHRYRAAFRKLST